MNFFKRLFGGSAAPTGDAGLYYYVACNRCGEVIRVRINPMNDLSQSDEGGFFVRKVAVGKRCYNRLELEFSYDSNRKLSDAQVQGGKLVDEAAYQQDQAAHPAEV